MQFDYEEGKYYSPACSAQICIEEGRGLVHVIAFIGNFIASTHTHTNQKQYIYFLKKTNQTKRYFLKTFGQRSSHLIINKELKLKWRRGGWSICVHCDMSSD